MRKNKYEYLSLDLTPLIDVIFILLIFFIVSSSFKKDKTILNLELPSSNSSTKVILKKELNIELNSKSLVFLGEKITFEQLENKIKKIKDKKKNIMINIDKKVSYEKVIKLLNILQKNDLNNIAFVTNKLVN